MAFFDVRVFNPIAKRYVHIDTSEAYQLNEKEKKNYNEGILEVEHYSFTPIVISAMEVSKKEVTNSTIRSLNSRIGDDVMD